MMTTGWEKIKNGLSSINNFALGRTPPARFLRYYVIVILLGTLFLSLRMTHQDAKMMIIDSQGKQLDNKVFHWYDGLFTAASAFSDTGLTVTTVSRTFNLGGQIVILLLIQIGGVGYMTIKVIIWRMFRKQISLSETIMMQSERGRSKLGGTVEMIIRAIKFLFIFEFLGTIVLTLLFYYSKPESLSPEAEVLNSYHNFKAAFWSGLFHSISAINNAGFDVIGGNSISEYRYVYGVQATILILFVIGGIGFPVIDEIYKKIKTKIKNGSQYYFSVFAKISILTYIIVALLGTSLTFFFEIFSPDIDIPNVSVSPVKGSSSFVLANTNTSRTVWHNKLLLNTQGSRVWAIIFNSMSTRNAGFSTIPPGSFTEQSQLLFIILMFIGAGPSSTAGGIRTTTFAIVIYSIIQLVKGKKNVHIFNRTIKPATVLRANVVAITGVIILVLGTIILLSSAQNYNYYHESNGTINVFTFKFTVHDALFETASAFGTTGLTTGLTPYINTYGKFSLIFIMFIGQLGMTNTLTVTKGIWANQQHHDPAPADVLIA